VGGARAAENKGSRRAAVVGWPRGAGGRRAAEGETAGREVLVGADGALVGPLIFFSH
jgi:hypothetical protein